MSRRHRIALALPAIAASLFAALPAAADDTSDLQGLLNETVVTTASKSAETSTTAPATSTTITAEDMRKYGIHSLDEAIDFLSLGVVTSNPLHAVDIGSRGVTIPSDQGNHFLLLVNGHAINEALFGAARFERGLGMPLELVDHIEVILGPGSVLYGSNAMLGVINVITKRAKDMSGGHVVLETEIGKSYRAAGLGGFELTLFGRPSEVTFGLEYYRQSGPAFFFGPQPGGIDVASGQPAVYTRDPNALPAGTWGGRANDAYYAAVPSAFVRFISGNLELNLHAKSYQRATPYRARYAQVIEDFNDADSYEIDRHIWGDIRYRASLSPVVELTTRLYGDSFDYRDHINGSQASGCLFEGVATCQYLISGVSRWVGLELQSSFDWKRDGSLVTLIGIDERIRHIGTKSDGTNYATGAPLGPTFSLVDRDDKTAAAYLQQTWQPTPWLGFNGGARVDYETRFRGVVSPRFAASANVWRGGTLKGIYAQAYRAPSWFETNFASQSGLIADNLRPESVRSVEASLEQRFGTQRILMGLFRSWWEDLVELHALTDAEEREAARQGRISLLTSAGFVQFRNVSSIDDYGLNAAYEGTLGDAQAFKYGMNVSAAVARRNVPTGAGTVAQPLTVAPQIFGNVRASYDLPGALPVLAVAAHYLGQRPVDRAYDGGWQNVPYAQPLIELRTTVSGPVPFIKGLSYRGTANFLMAPCAADLVGSHAACGPYVVGPVQNAFPGHTRPELSPLDRFRVGIGLQYDFGQ
jgi:outer membrane receptor for ferrienterochelin and colicins